MGLKIATNDEMRAIERAAVERGIQLESLMAVAGTRVADAVRQRSAGGNVLALVGPGNNGGDALIAAEQLRGAGYRVTVYTFRRSSITPFSGDVLTSGEDDEQRALKALVASSGVVIDGLLGIGQRRPVEGALAAVVAAVNEQKGAQTHSLSVDIPTGVQTDTGEILGEAFRADSTVCMGFLKPGVVLFPGAGYSGDVVVVDVGIPGDLARSVSSWLPAAPDIARLLPTRSPDSNKGSYGRLVYAGGSRDFLGAPALCSMAAYRAGAGLVELAVTHTVQVSVAAHLLEPVYTVLPEGQGQIAPDAIEPLRETLSRATSLVFGPGLGLSAGTIQLTQNLLHALPDLKLRGAVIDADGLNALSRLPDWWNVEAELVLTPHPGEMSRLTGESIKQIQSNRVDSARRYAERWQKVVVLKGARTIVASPDGQTTINPTGGPNLATGGTGDVLSGIIGGLIAQGCPPADAAVAGVYLHGYAGDRLRESHGEAGTVASDLLTEIPRARVAIERAAEVPR